MKYAVHMTDAERALLQSRLADAEKRIGEQRESIETLAVLVEEVRAVKSVLAWADGGKK